MVTRTGTPNAATETAIHWVLSKPVLTRLLREVCDEALAGLNGNQELACTVADLLDPDRGSLWRDILRATGVTVADADAIWRELGGDASWIDRVDWNQIRRVLLNQRIAKEGRHYGVVDPYPTHGECECPDVMTVVG